MRREVVALDTYDPASGISARAEDLSWAITSRPIWWEQSGYPPPTPHGEHLYDPGCAICKAGAAPWALRVVIDAILNDDSLRQGGMLKVTYPSPAARDNQGAADG